MLVTAQTHCCATVYGEDHNLTNDEGTGADSWNLIVNVALEVNPQHKDQHGDDEVGDDVQYEEASSET